MSDQDEEKILADARKLPISERVAHKSWKARGEAYDSISTACERALNEDDECFREFGWFMRASNAFAWLLLSHARPSCDIVWKGLQIATPNYFHALRRFRLCIFDAGSCLGKAASDANVAALDKALAAVVAYLGRCSDAHAER